MRLPVILIAIAFLPACERVDFRNRDSLPLIERAKAVHTLRLNAAAINAADMDALERTLHEEAGDVEQSIASAEAMIARYAPEVGIQDVKTVSDSKEKIVLEYTQTIAVKRGAMPFKSARAQTTLLRKGDGWGIASTQVLNLFR